MQKNQASLTRRTGSQSPERCGRSMSPPGLRFGSMLRARNHKTVPCQHSTAGWPPRRGRALPQCTGYSNHNNLRGHNISAHRRHTPHIQPHNTSMPQWGVSVSQWGSLRKRASLCPQTHKHTIKKNTTPQTGKKATKLRKIREQRQARVQAAISNKASKQKRSSLTSGQPLAIPPA